MNRLGWFAAAALATAANANDCNAPADDKAVCTCRHDGSAYECPAIPDGATSWSNCSLHDSETPRNFYRLEGVTIWVPCTVVSGPAPPQADPPTQAGEADDEAPETAIDGGSDDEPATSSMDGAEDGATLARRRSTWMLE